MRKKSTYFLCLSVQPILKTINNYGLLLIIVLLITLIGMYLLWEESKNKK
ncbi:MAG: hypothetical protein ACI9LN_004544 [Saprospiraceae bacterium]|jgi:hypothetical protein